MKRNILKKSICRCRRKAGVPREKLSENQINIQRRDWESNLGSVVHSVEEVPLCYLLPPLVIHMLEYFIYTFDLYRKYLHPKFFRAFTSTACISGLTWKWLSNMTVNNGIIDIWKYFERGTCEGNYLHQGLSTISEQRGASYQLNQSSF